MKTKINFKMYVLLILLAAYQLTIQSCKQPTDFVPSATSVKCDSANTVLIPEDMKARFYFKQGTYWIYKNIATGELDSMWVWKAGNEVNPTNPKITKVGLNKCYEGFGFFMRNKDYVNSDNYYFTLGIQAYPKDGLGIKDELFSLLEISSKNNYLGNLLFYNKGGEYEENNSQITIMDTINVLGLKYTNVLHFKYEGGSAQGLFDEMYYAKNIGLVKFVRSSDNSTWELIRYKINQ